MELEPLTLWDRIKYGRIMRSLYWNRALKPTEDLLKEAFRKGILK